MNASITSLGYPGSEYLERTDDGIVCRDESKQNLAVGLWNYPVTVQLTAKAIHNIIKNFDLKDEWSDFEIFANMKSGSEISLFTVNRNFFSRVFLTIDKNSSCLDDVEGVKYDPKQKSYSWDFFSERIPSKNSETQKGDVVVSFSANYNLGPEECTYLKTYEFANKFFNKIDYPEKLTLFMDVKEDDSWDLEIYQRSTKITEEKKETSGDSAIKNWKGNLFPSHKDKTND